MLVLITYSIDQYGTKNGVWIETLKLKVLQNPLEFFIKAYKIMLGCWIKHVSILLQSCQTSEIERSAKIVKDF